MRLSVGLFVLLAWCSAGVATAPLADVSILVHVDGFADDRGDAGIAVWPSALGFPEGIEHAVATAYAAIDAGIAEARFDGLPPGTYAVTVFHDRNGNRRFDKNWLGIPREAWGVSNNVHPRLRAPTFDEARVELAAGEHEIAITVR